MGKKSLILTATLSMLFAAPVFASGSIKTNYGLFKAQMDPTEYVAKLTLAGKKVGELEADNINIDKVYSLGKGKSQVVVLSSASGNSGFNRYILVAIAPNKTIKVYDEYTESMDAKYRVKNGKFIATYDEVIITFDGKAFHETKNTIVEEFAGNNIPSDTCKELYENLEAYEPDGNGFSQYSFRLDNEAQRYRAYDRKKLEIASRKPPNYSVFKKQVCTYKK